MYYEIYGEGQPLVLLHGAFSAIGSSFGNMIPGLATPALAGGARERRQVVGFDLQGHGRTADIDRPLTVEGMADDVAAALPELGIEQADILGYSNGGSVALHFATRHPQMVRKLVLMSIGYRLNGIHPGLMEGMGKMKPEMMYGSPWHDEYMRIAPRPQDFSRLFEKKTEMDRQIKDFSEETIRGIKAPVLLMIGDSDLIRPEHAVEFFRLLGGGVFGDMPPGLPNSQLAILPGTSHVGMVDRADWLVSMINSFLDAPVKNQ
jgi:pimeloyl-ACP methyl ester carboxylesterase